MKLSGTPETDKTLELLGKKLLRMNIDATEQRYTQPYLTPKEKKKAIKDFKFVNLGHIKPIQFLKSLNCFTYQCSEGNVPNRYIFKELTKLELDMAASICYNLPEYDQAIWG